MTKSAGRNCSWAFFDKAINGGVEKEWKSVAALLAEAWLVMNNPICVSLLLKPLVLQAHTAECVTDPL